MNFFKTNIKLQHRWNFSEHGHGSTVEQKGVVIKAVLMERILGGNSRPVVAAEAK